MSTMQTGTEDGPTSERGYPQDFPMNWNMWSADMQESAGDLRWPNSINVYHKMRTDAQIFALTSAISLPIRSSRWVIDPNGSRDEVTELVANAMGLPIKGQEEPAPRSRLRFNHDEHLAHALLALIYGFMFFEEVGEINAQMQWQLTKLAPRMPQSIQKINVDKVGELISIAQYSRPGEPMMEGLVIPANALAPYIWGKEGANWLGRSLLRPCYRHWLLKDRLIRVDAMKNERFGMGVPVATAPQGATRETVERYAAMARSARGDPQAGAGMAAGSKFSIEGVTGTLPDILKSITYHDEQMARSFLAMFLGLGQATHGSRALGESFVDFFKMSVDATAGWYKSCTNKNVIEDIVNWNYGIDENAPQITWDEDPESRMDATDLVALIESGTIVVDKELRTWISDRWGVSDPGAGTPDPPGPSPTVQLVPNLLPGEKIPALPAGAAQARAHRAEMRRRERWDSQNGG